MVGGGVGGLTVATRLSENPNVTVLVLEAGPIDMEEPWIRIPFFAGQGIGSIYDWNLVSAPQTYLNGATRAIPQGRALGGGSIINAMLWNRGGMSDYNDWVALGNPGWGWFDMLPYFVRVSTETSTYERRLERKLTQSRARLSLRILRLLLAMLTALDTTLSSMVSTDP